MERSSYGNAILEVVKWVLGAAIGAYFAWATVPTYPPTEFALMLVSFAGVLMVSATALYARQFSQASIRLGQIEKAMGRPAEFFPRQLHRDDGHYFTEIARHIEKTRTGETIWIVTSHLATPRSMRTHAVADARQAYHAAVEDRAAHGVHIRRVFCFLDDIDFNHIDGTYISRHTTDHCKRLQEIGRTHPDTVSLRASHNFTGADFLVISGRLAVVTADARDKNRVLKHVLCWMFFDPPNENVVETIREWCEGIDNGADIIREFPDGDPEPIEDEAVKSPPATLLP
jgi:hypothetical protein